MERLTTIRLYGKLGAKFGRVHRLAVATPLEAAKALCVTLDGFEQYLMHAKKNGMVFSVFRGERNLKEDELNLGNGDSDIRFAPVMIGAKRAGLFQTILGVALIGVAAFAPWGAAIGASNLVFTVGAGLAAGGAIQMLSPQTKGISTRQDADNKPSYAFGGAVNTTAMGNPVAILYGEREIGGAIISAGIVAEDI